MRPQGPDQTEAAPHFCPRCRRARRAGDRLCPECGEALRPQGYCPTCEARWPIEAGEPCPKHDLPLEPDAPPAGPPVGPEGAAGWVTVGRYGNPIEAEARRLRLEAEGIPTFLDGARMGSNYEVATGGVKLQVPRGFADDARILLAQSWAPPRTPEDDLDDAWDDLAPETPSTALLVAAWRVGLAVLVVGSLLIVALNAIHLASR